MKTALTAVPIIAVILLSACHGKSSPLATATYSPLTGVFSDAPVAGLTYRTSSGAAGTTDSQGRFNYAAVDTVTFSVGGLTLGSAGLGGLTPAGNAAVTPVNLLGTNTSDSRVISIGQLLGTLNSIAVARNIDAGKPLSSGLFTMPDNAADILTPLMTSPNVLTATSLTDAQLQTIAASGVASVTSAAASAVISVTSDTDAQLNMNQAVNAANVMGTVWIGTCVFSSCGTTTGTFYFQPDGNMTGFTSDGNILAGTWAGSSATPPASPAVQFSLISSAGGNYSGTIVNGATTATIFDSSSPPNTVFSLTQTNSSSNISPLTNPLTNNLYLGGWYGVYTPTGAADVYGAGTPVYLILSPDGTFSGIMDGNQTITGIISGNWTPTSGIGTGSFTFNSGATFSFNMATQSGLYSPKGQVYGSISFSRTGILSMISNPLTSSAIAMTPLTLSVQVSWPANPANFHSNFALSLNINNGSTLIASGIKSEANPLGNGAVAYTMTDSISVPYPLGATTTGYTLSINPTATPSNCSITAGGSGTVSSPTPVSITCN